MAIESMTGFARAAGTAGVHGWAWEIRSVNGRGLDLRVRVPPGFEVLAEAARKRLGSAFSRGTLHVNLAVTSDAGPPPPRVDDASPAAPVSYTHHGDYKRQLMRPSGLGAVACPLPPARSVGTVPRSSPPFCHPLRRS